MPRLTISRLEEQNRVIRGGIRNAQALQDMSIGKLSKLTGIPASTLYAKVRDPATFTIRELRDVYRVLKVPDAEKERLAREGM